jgi:hypothetical protein
MMIANMPFINVAQFKYLETRVTEICYILSTLLSNMPLGKPGGTEIEWDTSAYGLR